MPEHGSHTMERHCDVAIIGGSAVGLATALQLARRHRSVIVVDSGARHSDVAAIEREAARSHGVEVLSAHATEVTRIDDQRFRVALTGGHVVIARKMLDANDLTERTDIDDIDGLDEDAEARPPANETDWDQRYSGDQIWSGNPNGTLVNEVSDLTPGSALDVGAGEGGDVIWLAGQGWSVTAGDISQRALDRIGAAAASRGLTVALLHADANAVAAFGTGAFDLVSAQYASIPRTPDQRGITNVLNAVAPGGTLLIVGHDLEPMRQPHDPHERSRPFDPDAFVRVEDFVAVLTGSAEWEIEVNEKRSRPPGAVSEHHHDDIVLRARRATH